MCGGIAEALTSVPLAGDHLVTREDRRPDRDVLVLQATDRGSERHAHLAFVVHNGAKLTRGSLTSGRGQPGGPGSLERVDLLGVPKCQTDVVEAFHQSPACELVDLEGLVQ